MFKTEHFVSSDKKLVVTQADPERRIVTEINGAPAAREYARVVGLDMEFEHAQMLFQHGAQTGFEIDPLTFDFADFIDQLQASFLAREDHLLGAQFGIGHDGWQLMACPAQDLDARVPVACGGEKLTDL